MTKVLLLLWIAIVFLMMCRCTTVIMKSTINPIACRTSNHYELQIKSRHETSFDFFLYSEGSIIFIDRDAILIVSWNKIFLFMPLANRKKNLSMTFIFEKKKYITLSSSQDSCHVRHDSSTEHLKKIQITKGLRLTSTAWVSFPHPLKTSVVKPKHRTPSCPGNRS